MGTTRFTARGSGRQQLLGTARPRAGADIPRLRRHYGAVREQARRQAALRARAAQAAIAINAVAIATAIVLFYTLAPAGMEAVQDGIECSRDTRTADLSPALAEHPPVVQAVHARSLILPS